MTGAEGADDAFPHSQLRRAGGPIGKGRVRFVWSGVSGDAARWEQAFSVDGGETWLSNWIMEFSRRAVS